MANQKNINSYPDAGVPATGTKMLGVKDNKTALIDYDKLADAVLNKLTNKNFGGLTTNAKNLIDGISELNTGLANVNADLGRQSIKRFAMGNTKKFRITVPIDSHSSGNVISFLFFATYGAAFVSLIPSVSTGKVPMSAHASLSDYVTITSIDTGAEIAFTNYYGYVYYIVGNAVNMDYTIQPISS